MKTSKIFTLFAVAAAFALTSCIHMGDIDFPEIPDITFSYVWNCPTLELTACDGATDVTWELPDFGATGSGNTFSYTFEKAGSYWVVMKAKYNGKEQVYSGIIPLGKTSPISLTDGTLSDWDKVTDPKFIAEVNGSVLAGKYDFDSSYIYFYYECDLSCVPDRTINDWVVQVTMDVDGCAEDGSDYKMKYDYEGNPAGPEPWVVVADSGWNDLGDATLMAAVVSGKYEVDGNILKCEFGFKRNPFGITKDSYAFKFSWIDSIPWSTKGRFVRGESNVFVLDLSKF